MGGQRRRVKRNRFTFHYGSIQMPFGIWYSSSSSIYIPLWFYSNLPRFLIVLLSLRIYIPLWFYSNKYYLVDTVATFLFTFHYGSIQIGIAVFAKLRGTIFTFHYGSIQMNDIKNMLDSDRHLHSTMVLFKFYERLCKVCSWGFTFHYGSIQIPELVKKIPDILNLHSTMVLFK